MPDFDNINNIKGLLKLLDHESYRLYIKGNNSPLEPAIRETVSKGDWSKAVQKLLAIINGNKSDRDLIIREFGIIPTGDPLVIKGFQIGRKLLPSLDSRRDLQIALKLIRLMPFSAETKKALKDLLHIRDYLDDHVDVKSGRWLSGETLSTLQKDGFRPAINKLFSSLSTKDKTKLAETFGIQGQLDPRTLQKAVLTRPQDESDLLEALCRIDVKECIFTRHLGDDEPLIAQPEQPKKDLNGVKKVFTTRVDEVKVDLKKKMESWSSTIIMRGSRPAELNESRYAVMTVRLDFLELLGRKTKDYEFQWKDNINLNDLKTDIASLQNETLRLADRQFEMLKDEGNKAKSPDELLKIIRRTKTFITRFREILQKERKPLPACRAPKYFGVFVQHKDDHRFLYKCISYPYDRYFKNDPNLTVDKTKPGQQEKYTEISFADLNNDGKITFEEYLTYSSRFPSENIAVTKEHITLARYMARFKNIRALVERHGFEPLIKLGRHGFEPLIKSAQRNNGESVLFILSEVTHLINSQEDLGSVAKIADSFISSLSKKHFSFEEDHFKPISGAVKRVSGIRELEKLLNDYLTIANGLTNNMYGGFDDYFLRKLTALTVLFEKHGLSPFVAIARSSNSYALIKMCEPNILKMVEKHGIDNFVEMARLGKNGYSTILDGFLKIKNMLDSFGIEPFMAALRKYRNRSNVLIGSGLPVFKGFIKSPDDVFLYSEKIASVMRIAGDEAAYVLDALGEKENQVMIEKYGFDTYLHLLGKAKGSKREVSAFFSATLPAISHTVGSREDLKDVGGKILALARQVDRDSANAFFVAFKNLKHLLKNHEDIMAVANRLITLSKAAGEVFYALTAFFTTDTIKSRADLEADAVHLLKRAVETSKNRQFHIKLTEAQIKARQYSQALETVGRFEKLFTDHPKESLKLRYKIGMAVISRIHSPFFSSLHGTGPHVFALNIFKSIIEKDPDSPISRRALLIKDAMYDKRFVFNRQTVFKSRQMVIEKFSGIKGLSLISFDDPLMPEVIPGDASISNSGGVVVSKYYGKFTVVYSRPIQTIPANNDQLLKAHNVLPAAFLHGFKRMIFTGTPKTYAEGQYQSDSSTVIIYESSDYFGTIIHELAHHWDLKVAVGNDGRDKSFGDPSLLFYDISWTPEKIRREMTGDEWVKGKKKDRTDFDQKDFAYDYGMCNRMEDIATMAEHYVTKGPSLRETIRRQMENGKFELAAKYLFVKYAMPFRDREYEVNKDSLSVEEVEKKIEAWQKKRPNSVDQRIIETIKKIKEKYVENKYQ